MLGAIDAVPDTRICVCTLGYMSMNAAVLHDINNLRLESVPIPEPGPGEILLRIESNTICGTDLRIISGAKTAGVRPGVIMGHEFAGRIAVVGEGVTGYNVGTQATCSIVISCNRCRNCLNGREHLCENLKLIGYEINGGLAEYLLVPREAVAKGNVIVAPRELPATLLTLAEPLSCVINGANQYKVVAGDRVVVLGTGPIGLLHIALAKASGASRIVAVSRPNRVDASFAMGATDVVTSTGSDMVREVLALTDGGADVVVVAVGGLDLANQSLEVAGIGGRVNYFAGFPKGATAVMDPNLIHYRELQVTGGSNARRADVVRAVELLASGTLPVESLVTHRFPLSELDAAVEAVRARAGLKVAVIP